MINNKKEYEDVLKQLKALDIDIDKKEKELAKLKKEKEDLEKRSDTLGESTTGAVDRDGTPIRFGDMVAFLTKGLHNLSEGLVYKICSNKSRITCKDQNNIIISRAPHNTKVIKR